MIYNIICLLYYCDGSDQEHKKNGFQDGLEAEKNQGTHTNNNVSITL